MNKQFQLSNPVDTIEIKLNAVLDKVFPLIDILVNKVSVVKDVEVSANLVFKQTDTIILKGDFHDLTDLGIKLKNDTGVSRVDIKSILFNGHEINVQQGVLTRDTGTVYSGQNIMYWNGTYSLDANALQAADFSNLVYLPVKHTVDIDLSGIQDAGLPEVNIFINGELVMANHGISANLLKNEKETVTIETDSDDISTVVVQFVNDNGPRRVDIGGVRVDGHALDLSHGVLTKSTGAVAETSNKLFWNGQLSLNVPAEYNNHSELGLRPDHTAPDNTLPDPAADDVLPTEENDITMHTSRYNSSGDWGGIDPNKYRGDDYTGRERPVSDPHDNTGVTLKIDTGTTVKEIQAMIAKVPLTTHLNLIFSEGTHVLTEKLLITRGDITIAGMGEDKTSIVADFAKGKIDNFIQIQGSDIRNDAGSNNGRWSPERSDYVGTATSKFDVGSHTLSVSSTKGLSVGDHIMVNKVGTASATDDSDEFGTIAEISAIHGNQLVLKQGMAFASSMLGKGEKLSDVKVYEIDLLENVTVRDFSIRYDIKASEANNPNHLSMNDMMNTIQYNFFPDYAAGAGGKNGDLSYGHNRALVLSGTDNANVKNISMHDIGSNGFFFSTNLETSANNLTVAGTHNMGANGNGYGIEYDKTYYSDFTDLTLYDLRHGITANKMGGNGFNNFRVTDSNANLDFHGGRDQANIYYVKHLDIKPYFVPELAKNGDLLPDIDYGQGRVQFSPISYRSGGDNAKENTVIWDYVAANDGAQKGGTGGFFNALKEQVAAYHSNNNDFLVASNNGSKLYGGFGNDILVSGQGNDLLSGGVNKNAAYNSDIFIFESDNGRDNVTDFEAGWDQIHIQKNANGNGIYTVNDILEAAHEVGNNVVIDLGAGNQVTLLNTDIHELNNHNVHILDARSFYGF